MAKGRIVSLAVILAFMVVLGGTALVPHEKQPPSQYAPLEQTTLFVASDLHYLSPELTDNGEYFHKLIENGDGKAMGFCEDITDAFITQVIGQKPDVLILSGDLTFNGEKASHTVLAEKLSAVKEAGIPVLVLPGNHDLENPMALKIIRNVHLYIIKNGLLLPSAAKNRNRKGTILQMPALAAVPVSRSARRPALISRRYRQ